jgi:hypothetical protein
MPVLPQPQWMPLHAAINYVMGRCNCQQYEASKAVYFALARTSYRRSQISLSGIARCGLGNLFYIAINREALSDMSDLYMPILGFILYRQRSGPAIAGWSLLPAPAHRAIRSFVEKRRVSSTATPRSR